MAVFLAVAAVQFWLVAKVGTDIPIFDQWDSEGAWLYPGVGDGSLRWADLVRPHNEHRIAFTHGLNWLLFVCNGAWDPLVQLFAGVLLRAGCAAVVAGCLAAGRGPWRGWLLVGVWAYLPHLAWHNVLWGFQTQVWFSLGLALAAFALLGRTARSPVTFGLGWLAAFSAQFAMGSGSLISLALGMWLILRAASGGLAERARWLMDALGTAVLLLLAVGLRSAVEEHQVLASQGAGQLLFALGRVLAWPHTDVPMAALVMNLPFAAMVGTRLLRRRPLVEGEDPVLLAGFWAVAIAAATAWYRGGSVEFSVGVPSRYVDFLVLLPVVNLWSAFRLVGLLPTRWRQWGRLGAVVWGVFLAVGWFGLSAEVMRGMVLPRLRDPAAPVRLAVTFQKTWNPVVYSFQPRFYCPHPRLATVREVLEDPRLQGRLPPTFQPQAPLGPLSFAVRWLRMRTELFTVILTAAGLWLAFGPGRRQGPAPASVAEPADEPLRLRQ